MLDMENMPGELLRLSGMRLGFGGGTISGAGGTSGKAQLFNPVGSGHIVILTSAIWGLTSNSTFRWGTNSVALTTHLATQILRDTREISPVRPVAQVRTQIAAALAEGTNQTRVLANQMNTLHDENSQIVLAPGTGFEMGPTTNAISMLFSFYWRERVAEPSEINF